MNEYFSPIDSLVSEIRGNIKFLDNLLSKTNVLLGIVGIVGTAGVIVAVALLIK